jgi:hypothetical protein
MCPLLLPEDGAFPTYMFPLRCIEKLRSDRSSSRLWLRLKTQCEREYQNANPMVFCGEHISNKNKKGNILGFNRWEMKPIVQITLYLFINCKDFSHQILTRFDDMKFMDLFSRDPTI